MGNFCKNVWFFYRDGFRNMTWGRVLWILILVKLTVMFLVLKLFFFPDFIGEHASDGDEAQFVGTELLERSVQANP